jgi:histidinol-phosphatase (PHP family)
MATVQLPADYHVHTRLCKHASGEPAEYLDVARSAGLPQICFSDHAPAPDGYDTETRMDMDQFPAYRAMVEPLRAPGSPGVLFGIEADYYPGGLPFLREWLPAQRFDLVLGSVHFVDGWPFDHPAHLAEWKSVDVSGVWRRYFELVGALADTRAFDAVAHLDLPKKFGHRPGDPVLREAVLPALDRMAAAGMAVEVNTSGLRKPVREIFPSQQILAWALEREIPITFGSDAHRPEDVGHAFAEAVRWARDAGYQECVRYRGRCASRVPLTPGG